MEISIQEKVEHVAQHFNWKIIPDTTCISIDGPIERRGWNFYIKCISGNNWFHENEIEKLYKLTMLFESVNSILTGV